METNVFGNKAATDANVQAEPRPGSERRRRVLLTLFVAATLGALGIGVGSWFGWQSAGTLPSTEQATSVAMAAFPGLSVKSVSRDDHLFAYTNPGDNHSTRVAIVGTEGYGPGYVTIVLTMPRPDPSPLASGATRLRAAGWYVRQHDLYGVMAERDNVALRAALVDRYLGADDVVVTFERPEPAASWWLGLLGWGVGVGAGLLLAVWVIGSGIRLSRLLLLVGAAVLSLHTIGTTLGFFLGRVFEPDLLPPTPAWDAYMEVLRFLAIAGFLLIAGAAGVIGYRRVRREVA